MISSARKFWNNLIAFNKINNDKIHNATFHEFFNSPKEIKCIFDNNNSIIDRGTRYIHQTGYISLCKWDYEENNIYNGVFQENLECIVRYGCGSNMINLTGMGMKLFNNDDTYNDILFTSVSTNDLSTTIKDDNNSYTIIEKILNYFIKYYLSFVSGLYKSQNINLCNLSTVHPKILNLKKNKKINCVEDCLLLEKDETLGELYDEYDNKVASLVISEKFIKNEYADKHLSFKHNMYDYKYEPISTNIYLHNFISFVRILYYTTYEVLTNSVSWVLKKYVRRKKNGYSILDNYDINGSNFINDYYNKIETKNMFYDKIYQYIFPTTNHYLNILPKSEWVYITKHNKLVYFPMYILYMCVVLLFKLIEYIFYRKYYISTPKNLCDNYLIENQFKYVLDTNLNNFKPYKFPQQSLVSFQGIDYLCNYSINILDIIERSEDGKNFVIDTTLLDKYEKKTNGFDKIGCKGYFSIVNNKLHLEYIVYAEKRYDRVSHVDDDELFITLYLFYSGILTYSTIYSHLLKSHYLVSSKISYYNNSLLPKNHPLRNIMRPTEINVQKQMLSSLKTLLSSNYNTLSHIVMFTDIGIKDFIKDNLYVDYMKPNFVDKLTLSEEEKQCISFKTYIKWYNIISKFSEDFVNELGENDCKNVETWIEYVYPEYKKFGLQQTIKKIITLVYFNQIEHQMNFNENILFYVYKNIPLIYKNNEGLYTKYINILNYISLLNVVVNINMLKMNVNLSNLIDKEKYSKLHEVYDNFYKTIIEWDENYNIDIDLPLLKPSNINISTGL